MTKKLGPITQLPRPRAWANLFTQQHCNETNRLSTIGNKNPPSYTASRLSSAACHEGATKTFSSDKYTHIHQGMWGQTKSLKIPLTFRSPSDHADPLLSFVSMSCCRYFIPSLSGVCCFTPSFFLFLHFCLCVFLFCSLSLSLYISLSLPPLSPPNSALLVLTVMCKPHHDRAGTLQECRESCFPSAKLGLQPAVCGVFIFPSALMFVPLSIHGIFVRNLLHHPKVNCLQIYSDDWEGLWTLEAWNRGTAIRF